MPDPVNTQVAPRMGRPPSDPEDIRSHLIKFHLTPAEFAEVQKQGDSDSPNLAARELLLDALGLDSEN